MNSFHRIAIALLTLLLAFTAQTAPSWDAELRSKLEAMADELTATLLPWEIPNRIFEVEDFGAMGDGVALNTEAIQAAIDACTAAGGGVVRLSKGDYLTGTVVLKSGVMLEIAEGASMIASIDLDDYPEHVASRRTVMDTNMGMNQSLIFAENVQNIGIRGPGVIDFRGSQENFPGKQTITATPGRPFGIRVLDSRNIVVENITLRNAACWMQNYLNCEDLIFQDMHVINHANHNNDGLDIDGCRRVIIRRCTINSEDDAMCIKGASLRPSEDILIEDSTFVTTCNALKIGTDTQGDFRRIYARNLVLGGIPDAMESWKGRQASTGITIATVDGGDVEDILVENIHIQRSRCPIFIRIGSRGRLMPDMPPAKIGKLSRIVVENVTGVENFRQGSYIAGIPEQRVQDIILRNYRVHMEGGGTEAMLHANVPDNAKGYPDAHQFNVKGLPAYGIWMRHAERVTLDNVQAIPMKADARPMILVEANCESTSILP